MKTKGFVVVCVLLLALPGCKALAGALIEYIDSWDTGANGRVRKVGGVEGEEQVGDWSFFYENGNKMAAGQYKNDHPYGEWSHWYKNGNLKSQGSHDDDGARTGLWTYYHDNGVPSARGSFAEDQEHGPWTFTSRDGARLQRGGYERGLKAGLWTSWHTNGQKSAEGCYSGDARVGAWRVWSGTGDVSVADYPMPAGVVLRHEAWPDGTSRRLGMLQQGQRTGTWVTWHRNGEQRLVCCFQDGAAAGTWSSYRADGELLAEGELHEGMLEDWWVWTKDTSTAQQRMPLPQLPPSPGGDWSEASVADAESAGVVFATWLAEMRSPKTYTTVAAVPAGARAASQQQVTALDADRRAVPDAQPAWTERERAEYDKWVKAYSVGMAQLRSLMGRYGGSTKRKPKPKVTNRDDMKDKPCPFDQLQGVDGGMVRLSDYRGKKKVLVVILRGYSGEVCVYCVAQTEALANYKDTFDKLNLEVLVVYPGPKEKEKAFRECFEAEFDGQPPPYRTFYDPGLQLVNQLGIAGGREAYPTTLLIDEQGIIQYAYTGKNAADRPAAQDLIKLIEKLMNT